MRATILALFVSAMAPAALAKSEVTAEPSTCATAPVSGQRTLCHEIVVPASLDQAWALWTTTEGLGSWAAPFAAIDLKVGGLWEAAYRSGARAGDKDNIRNRVLSYLPKRMLSIQIEAAPPGFEHVEEARTLWTVIEFEPVDAAHTRVRVSMPGFRDGAAYDDLYGLFGMGNPFTLTKFSERVTTGAADWSALGFTPTDPGDVKRGAN